MEIENNENENNNQVEQIPNSLQGEINLVREEEEENKDGPTQKERLEKMLTKLNKDEKPEEKKPAKKSTKSNINMNINSNINNNIQMKKKNFNPLVEQ